ncbi:hypothetical protein RvY_03504-2 [Ramazzottius varieornatus]|uniref:Uncharacterized protein n=1 Tax=Ramazzottius varieornatus TaxID=947166 RepID=A0A1D1UNA0_RAMVA|nr:hypothetical protein RvY_03504-2 [Ramazzottius varieornatus]
MRTTEKGTAGFPGSYRRDGWNVVIHWFVNDSLVNRVFLPEGLQRLGSSWGYRIFRGESPHRANNVFLVKFGFHSFPKNGVAVRWLIPAGFLHGNVFTCLWATDVGFNERRKRLFFSRRLVRLGNGCGRKTGTYARTLRRSSDKSP